MLPMYRVDDTWWMDHSVSAGYLWTWPIWNCSFFGQEWRST